MVRRDEDDGEAGRPAAPTSSRCASPTGGSPDSVSAGAPSSRLRVPGREAYAQAERRKPARQQELRSGERAHGPQHEVKPAASTEKQSESRAGHLTAKATSRGPAPERTRDLGGVLGAARVQGEVRNTRDPSAQRSSPQARAYKPEAKSHAAQRESEGAVVPLIATQKNAAEGRGPCFGRVGEAGKREGMAARRGPNDPGGRRPRDEVRQLRRRLWAAAKRAPGRRFHALYDHIARSDVLAEAWKQVRSNRGAAGVGGGALVGSEQRGVGVF